MSALTETPTQAQDKLFTEERVCLVKMTPSQTVKSVNYWENSKRLYLFIWLCWHVCFSFSSESVKQRTNVFYLHPERCCVPNSPLWFSSTPLDDSTMEAMLTRILTVRELQLRKEKGMQQQTSADPPFIPDEEDQDSEWWGAMITDVTFYWCSKFWCKCL